MQLTSPAPTSSPLPSMPLGTIQFHTWDDESEVAGGWSGWTQIEANGTLDPRGEHVHPSLRTAIEAAQALTFGEAAAPAVIIERAGRYHAVRVLGGLDLEPKYDGSADGGPENLEETIGWQHYGGVDEIRIRDAAAGVRALVDGEFVHRFRGS